MLARKRKGGIELSTSVFVGIVLAVLAIVLLISIYFAMSSKAAPWLVNLPKSLLSILV